MIVIQEYGLALVYFVNVVCLIRLCIVGLTLLPQSSYSLSSHLPPSTDHGGRAHSVLKCTVSLPFLI